jgi:hypothetical protein
MEFAADGGTAMEHDGERVGGAARAVPVMMIELVRHSFAWARRHLGRCDRRHPALCLW